ncbi:hypothetical protein P280DRAFT_44815 [Massarina eburnea CBS 473.64]|uniref:Uncharacterized protein n=1 Tax=Massarina eburnea CBS 473.64 TaxID=1395130 RepID=A0A6A6S0E3_9PLEO|nr:hypothetical protein P280DRAFT_44815 [Massarina eburnea CBS 473.64]
MAPPILIREINTREHTRCLPGSAVQVYRDLVMMAQGMFGKPNDAYKVHFHLQDGPCEEWVDEFLWNTGTYFKTLCNGKLPLFAHFEQLQFTWASPVFRSETFGISNMSGPIYAAPTGFHFKLESTTAYSPPMGAHNAMGLPNIPRSAFQHPSFEPAIQQQGTIMQQNWMHQSGAYRFPQPTVPEYPRLPASVSANTWTTDFEAAVNREYVPGDKYYKKNVSAEQKRATAHASLIDGAYGVYARNPCNDCCSSGFPCLIYNPNMLRPLSGFGYLPPGNIGKKCSRCRAFGNGKFARCTAQ